MIFVHAIFYCLFSFSFAGLSSTLGVWAAPGLRCQCGAVFSGPGGTRALAASPEGTWMCLTFYTGCFLFVCDIWTDTSTSGKWDCVFVCFGVGRPDGKVGVKPEAGENRLVLIRLNTLPLTHTHTHTHTLH